MRTSARLSPQDLIALLFGCAIGIAISITIELRRSPSTWERIMTELHRENR